MAPMACPGTIELFRSKRWTTAAEGRVIYRASAWIPPLPVADARAGMRGAVVGHPAGQRRPRRAPAVVRRQASTVGPDIYRDDAVRREVLFLAANFQSGDSGGPLGDAAGRVVGVAFAVAPDRSSTAYALPDEEIGAVLQAPATGRTGPCVR